LSIGESSHADTDRRGAGVAAWPTARDRQRGGRRMRRGRRASALRRFVPDRRSRDVPGGSGDHRSMVPGAAAL